MHTYFQLPRFPPAHSHLRGLNHTLTTHPPPATPPQMLGRILDRSHLASNSERPYPDSGTGYEVVAQIDGSGLLKGVE